MIRAMGEAIGALLLIAAACHAEQPCPFLNNATAEGVLGAATIATAAGHVCMFTRGSSQLRIEVETVSLPYKSHCEPNPTPLKAIGNEAVACSVESGNGYISELINGRVRGRAFFIRLTSNNIARSVLREKACSVAEQVAGILY
jgi:hypothetical protein